MAPLRAARRRKRRRGRARVRGVSWRDSIAGFVLCSRPSVIIECSNCRARYQYDEDRFDRKPSKKIKCAKCGSVFEIHNPAFAAPKPAATDNDTTASKHEA